MANSIFTLSELKENYESLKRLLSEVQADHVHMQKALDMLERMPQQNVPGDIAGQAKANAAMEIVRTREHTNQKLIEVYVKMYDDLREVIFEKDDSKEICNGEN
ncbi:MAG: hypothetical protein PUA84_09170 [Oscillospiraceae bacterium]|nr:hypothetical protein [Oscillospiraceae bacterium]